MIKSMKVKEGFNLEKYLEERIVKNVPEYELEYIQGQTSLIQQYVADRDKELDNQVSSLFVTLNPVFSLYY